MRGWPALPGIRRQHIAFTLFLAMDNTSSTLGHGLRITVRVEMSMTWPLLRSSTGVSLLEIFAFMDFCEVIDMRFLRIKRVQY